MTQIKINRDHTIAIVGLEECGKTAFLTRFIELVKGTPSTIEAHDFIEKKKKFLNGENKDDWEATEPLSAKQELKWEISRSGRKFVLSFKDFSGEECKGIINDSEGTSTVEEFLKSADTVLVCLDLKKLLNDKNQYQTLMIQMIKKSCVSTVRFGLVVTKWDAIKDYVDDKNKGGGLDKVLRKYIDNEIIDDLKDCIFPVSVAEFQFDTENKKDLPQRDSQTFGFEGKGGLNEWVFSCTKNTERKRYGYSTALIALIIVLVTLFWDGVPIYKILPSPWLQWTVLFLIIAGIVFCAIELKKLNFLKKGC